MVLQQLCKKIQSPWSHQKHPEPANSSFYLIYFLINFIIANSSNVFSHRFERLWSMSPIISGKFIIISFKYFAIFWFSYHFKREQILFNVDYWADLEFFFKIMTNQRSNIFVALLSQNHSACKHFKRTFIIRSQKHN